MVAFNFNANDHDPQAGFEPVPADWYDVALEKSELVQTKDGQGGRLKVIMNILSGPFQGQKIFEGYNIQNKNQDTMDIAFRQLSALCHCVGKFTIIDTSELHGIPFKVRVILKDRTDANGNPTGEKTNEVRGYKDANGNPPGQLTGGAPQTANIGGQAPAQNQGFANQQPPAQTPETPQVPQNQPPAQPTLQMTDKAGGNTLEAFLSKGWTAEQLVQEGYAIQAPANAPAKTPQTPQTPDVPAGGWAQGNPGGNPSAPWGNQPS